MLRILFLAAMVWWGGRFLGLPVAIRRALVVLLFATVVIIQLTLPDGHGLRVATGGSLAGWLMLGGIGLLALGYGSIISALKRRAQPKETFMPQKTGSFSRLN